MPLTPGELFTPVSQNAKSQLAKLMAQESIRVEHKNIPTAAFDTKNRILMLPIWKDMSPGLYDCLIGHEVGHALETPNLAPIFQKIVDQIDPKNPRGVKGFLNVIEDARIERLIKITYPGMRHSFREGYKELFAKDFFQTKGKDTKKFSFIDRINVHFKLGAMALIPFSAEESKYVDMVENTLTWDDVVSVTETIYAFCKQKNKEKNQSETDKHQSQEEGEEGTPDETMADSEDDGLDDSDTSTEEDSDEAGENGTDGDESDQESQDGNSKKEEEKDGESDKTPTNSKKQTENKESGKPSKDVDAGNPVKNPTPNQEAKEEEPLAAKTDDAWEGNKESLVSKSQNTIRYMDIPYGDYINTNATNDFKNPGIVNSYRKVIKDFQPYVSMKKNIGEASKTFRVENSKAISFMVKEFEMRKAADLLSRTSISRTGVIDSNKLHAYKYSEDIFRRVSTVSGGKNHGLVMFIDWSSSMYTNLSDTIRQLLILVQFCKQIQIPFEVYAFSSKVAGMNSFNTGEYVNNSFTGKDKSTFLQFRRFVLHQFFAPGMSNIEHEAMVRVLLLIAANPRGPGNSWPVDYGLSSTPLNQTIMAATPIISAFRKKTKVQIINTVFLTDGDSEACSGPPSENHLYSSYIGYGCIIRDPVTRLEYSLEDRGVDANVTKILLHSLKERTGCNVLGFHIVDNNKHGNVNMVRKYFPNATDIKTVTAKFREEKLLVVTSAGYDELYLIPGGDSLSTEVKELDIKGARTTGSLTKAFSAYSKQKKTNRVLLTSFIKKIA